MDAMKYHIWTEGCQMNVADSQRVSAALENFGCTGTKDPAEADVIVLNTCVVRQSAEDKAYGRLSSLKPLKKKNPNLVINLMGCLVGINGNPKLKERFPYVDVFSPPSDPQPLLNHLLSQSAKTVENADAEFRYSVQDGILQIPVVAKNQQITAFVPILLGCSHACTYCVIPGKRGKEKSRNPDDIFREVVELTESGVKEITLLGQIVDRYGKDEPGYPDLLALMRKLSQIEQLQRIRFLTSHPLWMTDELLETVATLPKVMPHIEAPIQAGDDEILRQMRRGYTADQYRDLVGRIRKMIPHSSIATDVIVGFPGETEVQFMHTYDLLSELKMDVAHLARYSPRPGTVSAETMTDNVPAEEKWRRFRMLEVLQEKIATEIHSQYLEKSVEVLFEEKTGNRWRGRTPTNKLVFVESEKDLRGKLVNANITWTGPWSMIGELA
jgi:tRNA-2-methylthio-N6-dimethylallyladenosine synthase